MKEKLLALLKTKFQGVDDAILDRIATKRVENVTDESQLPAIIEGIGFSDVLQSYGDYRAGDATVRAIGNYERKHNLKDGKPIEQPAPEPKPQDKPEPAQKIDFDPEKFKSDLLKEFGDIINGQKRKEALSATLRTKLDEAKIPASYYIGRIEGRDFKDEEEITAYVEKTVKDYGDFKQELANEGFQQVIPPQPAEAQQKTEEENLIAEIEKGTQQIVEQKNQSK
jgi:hypothetical protein